MEGVKLFRAHRWQNSLILACKQFSDIFASVSVVTPLRCSITFSNQSAATGALEGMIVVAKVHRIVHSVI
jgi:hypothetical protein